MKKENKIIISVIAVIIVLTIIVVILNKIKLKNNAGIGNSIMKKIKSIFGVHSPSTEFAWVGKMNMLGLEKGMEDMKGQVNSTVGGMFDDMFNLSPNLYGNTSNNLSPVVNVVNHVNVEQHPEQILRRFRKYDDDDRSF